MQLVIYIIIKNMAAFKTPEDFRDNAAKAFNNAFRTVTDMLISKHPKDYDLADMREKLVLVMIEMPIMVVEVSGPYVWTYRELIRQRNIEELIKNDYATEVTELAKSKNPKVVDTTNAIITKVKDTWPKFTEPEREVVADKFVKLLTSYASFLGACRKLPT